MIALDIKDPKLILDACRAYKKEQEQKGKIATDQRIRDLMKKRLFKKQLTRKEAEKAVVPITVCCPYWDNLKKEMGRAAHKAMDTGDSISISGNELMFYLKYGKAQQND